MLGVRLLPPWGHEGGVGGDSRLFTPRRSLTPSLPSLPSGLRKPIFVSLNPSTPTSVPVLSVPCCHLHHSPVHTLVEGPAPHMTQISEQVQLETLLSPNSGPVRGDLLIHEDNPPHEP